MMGEILKFKRKPELRMSEVLNCKTLKELKNVPKPDIGDCEISSLIVCKINPERTT